jgi:predicted ATP-grasp superfamily ATP-dependent carboligase
VDERIGRPLAEIIRRLGWSGIFEFQLLRSADDAYLIDLNPRPYGSLALAIGAGLNLPAIWVDLLLGREPRVGRPVVGVRYRAESREVKAFGQALRGRRIRQALAIARPRRRTVHAIFSLRDPAPVLVALMRAGRKARLRTSSCSTGTSTTTPASSPSTASGSWSKAA